MVVKSSNNDILTRWLIWILEIKTKFGTAVFPLAFRILKCVLYPTIYNAMHLEYDFYWPIHSSFMMRSDFITVHRSSSSNAYPLHELLQIFVCVMQVAAPKIILGRYWPMQKKVRTHHLISWFLTFQNFVEN